MNTLIEMVSNGTDFVMMKAGIFGAIIMTILIFLVWAVFFITTIKFYDVVVHGIHKSKIYIRDYIEYRKEVKNMIKVFGSPYKVNILKANGKWKEKKYYF